MNLTFNTKNLYAKRNRQQFSKLNSNQIDSELQSILNDNENLQKFNLQQIKQQQIQQQAFRDQIKSLKHTLPDIEYSQTTRALNKKFFAQNIEIQKNTPKPQ